MHKYFRSSNFFGPNDETQLNYYSYGLNSIPDFFLNYWSKKDRLIKQTNRSQSAWESYYQVDNIAAAFSIVRVFKF